MKRTNNNKWYGIYCIANFLNLFFSLGDSEKIVD